MSNSKKEECDHIQDLKIDLNEIKMFHDPVHKKEIVLNNEITIFLKYPTVDSALIEINDDVDVIVDFLSEGIEFIKHKDTMYETKDYTKQEKRDFFEQFNQVQMAEVQQFYETQPALIHEMKYNYKYLI